MALAMALALALALVNFKIKNIKKMNTVYDKFLKKHKLQPLNNVCVRNYVGYGEFLNKEEIKTQLINKNVAYYLYAGIIPFNLSILIKKVILEIDEIFEIVCNYFNTTREEILKKTRVREIVMIRHIIYWLVRKYNKRITTLTICKILGNKDHSSAITSVYNINNLYETDKKFKKQLDEIINICNNYKKEHDK
jgi:hypothetical protein